RKIPCGEKPGKFPPPPMEGTILRARPKEREAPGDLGRAGTVEHVGFSCPRRRLIRAAIPHDRSAGLRSSSPGAAVLHETVTAAWCGEHSQHRELGRAGIWSPGPMSVSSPCSELADATGGLGSAGRLCARQMRVR